MLIHFFSLIFQGLPTCPLSIAAVRSHLPDLSCWGLPSEGAAGSNPTTLHRFYKAQRKMPGFRGRRGLCGCLQVNINF